MYKGRPKIWAIFLIVCLLSQLLISVAPAVVNSIKEACAEAELRRQEEARLEAEKEAQQALQSTEETAGSENEGEKTDEERLDEAFDAISSVIGTTARYIGILIMIYGMFSFVMGFIQEDSAAMTRCVSMLVVGGALVGASVILTNLFVGNVG